MNKTIPWILAVALMALPGLVVAQQQAQEKTEQSTQKKTQQPTQAQTTDETDTSAPSFEVLDAKLCSGVQDKQPIDEKSIFQAGDKAWLWLKLKPQAETTMRLRWSLNDRTVWTSPPVTARLGRNWYYKTLRRPGQWKVEVLDTKDKVVYTSNLTATAKPREKTGKDTKTTAGAQSTLEDSVAASSKPDKTAAKDSFEVLELKLTERVENREPVDPKTVFEKGGKVYCWTKLKVQEEQAQVKMRWSHADQVVHTSEPVTVKQSPSWRLWLNKTVDKSGDWKVEILDQQNKSIHAANFTVK